jgi:hypothetical protein
MIATIHTGPTLLAMAHAARQDDFRRAADHRRALRFTEARRAVRRKQRSHPWWWGLARSRPAGA